MKVLLYLAILGFLALAVYVPETKCSPFKPKEEIGNGTTTAQPSNPDPNQPHVEGEVEEEEYDENDLIKDGYLPVPPGHKPGDELEITGDALATVSRCVQIRYFCIRYTSGAVRCYYRCTLWRYYTVSG